jgi:hypothetical protein
MLPAGQQVIASTAKTQPHSSYCVQIFTIHLVAVAWPQSLQQPSLSYMLAKAW